MDSEQAAVLATLHRYFDSISNTAPPLTAARSMVVGEAGRVICPGAGMSPAFYTMSQTLDILEDRVRETPGIAERFVDPEPEVWVHNDLACIWTGSEQSVGGEGLRRGVHIFSLLRHPEPGAGWKIAGVTTVARQVSDQPPPVIKDADSEVAIAVIQLIQNLLAAASQRDWETFAAAFHTDMRASLSRGSWPPVVIDVDALVDRLKAAAATFPPGAVLKEEIHDVEVRVCGDLALVWAPFVVTVESTIRSLGVNIFRILKLGSEWKVVGFADTSSPAQ
ncbi:hypothetical protein Micbo1qcDRAFT_205828 [Microdochium bolleyi]|uniref:SnoaL-like domain-containing protein n=1 Tax=Microdochium bolleyi TaxID=196109 RepID=A0A136IZI8_9PEZI|nr:hypothetical protein Micbo1qcDRAFT_205828 [Microdochium bolleyi]